MNTAQLDLALVGTSQRVARPKTAKMLVGGLAAAAVAALIGTAAISASESVTQTVKVQAPAAAPQTDTPTPLVDLVAPAGMLLVVDHDGLPRGYIPETAIGVGASPRFVTLVDRKLEGLEVVDASGQPTGYMLATLGFVELSAANNPLALDALFADQQRREREMAVILAGRGETP